MSNDGSKPKNSSLEQVCNDCNFEFCRILFTFQEFLYNHKIFFIIYICLLANMQDNRSYLLCIHNQNIRKMPSCQSDWISLGAFHFVSSMQYFELY